MFSPYYARARRRGPADPLNYCAVNVALYGRGGHRWAMTERGRGAVRRDAGTLGIGPSSLAWDGNRLRIDIDEWTAPLPSRLRGTVTVRPETLPNRRFALDAAGRHHWQPIAPRSGIEVAMDSPEHRWSGSGYFDHNSGAAPLEADFARWHWSRTAGAGPTTLLYDVTRRDGSAHTLALDIDAAGVMTQRTLPPPATLPNAPVWRIARSTRADPGTAAHVIETLEDTPFYARSLISSELDGRRCPAIHETLSLDRFTTTAVQLMLPFRMPRVWW